MSEKFYFQYFWGPDKKSIVISCTIFNIEAICQFSRGVSVCSPDDEIDVLKGERIAYRYALRGGKGRADKLITDLRAIRVLATTSCPYWRHSDKDPNIAWHELKKLLTSKDFHKLTNHYSLKHFLHPEKYAGELMKQKETKPFTIHTQQSLYLNALEEQLPSSFPK